MAAYEVIKGPREVLGLRTTSRTEAVKYAQNHHKHTRTYVRIERNGTTIMELTGEPTSKRKGL